jgi:ATP-dependent Clp protease adaptor protein ClpS
MSQSTSKAWSSKSASLAVFAPRMSNDENRGGGVSGPSTSVITKVKPKTQAPEFVPRPDS